MPDYDEINKKRFGRRLTSMRLASGISQRELADSAKIHFQELYRYEKGLRMPRDAILNSIAAALRADPYYLKYGDPGLGNYSPHFSAENIGEDFGKEYTLEHVNGAGNDVTPEELLKKMKKLSAEDLRVMNEMADCLYYDSHPEELEKVLEKEEESFEKLKESTKKDPKHFDKMKRVVNNYLDDLYRLFPEKYDEYLERKKSLAQIDGEIRGFIQDNYPDLIEDLEANEEWVDILNRSLGPQSDEDPAAFEERYPICKYIHSKTVPELKRRMQKDFGKRPGKEDIEVYEASRDEHIRRMMEEGRLKIFRDKYLELLEKENSQ